MRTMLQKRPPLFGHSGSDTLVGAAAILPAVRRGWLSVNAIDATINDVGRCQEREPFQPKARSLNFTMPELPRLNDLIRFADLTTDDTDRILKGNARRASIQQAANKFQRLILLRSFILKPARATNGKVRAGREGNQQVPSTVQHELYRTLIVALTGAFTRQKVTAIRLVAAVRKCIANYATELTGNQNFHTGIVSPSVSTQLG